MNSVADFHWCSNSKSSSGGLHYYNIPASKIGPKPFQKPHPPIYMGAFSPKAFGRVVKYANGWIGMIVGSLEDFKNTVNIIKDKARKEANKDASSFKIILWTYPNIMDLSSSKRESQRSPMTGTIDEIGSDLKIIKGIGVDISYLAIIFYL
jgi:hypothetical protein